MGLYSDKVVHFIELATSQMHLKSPLWLVYSVGTTLYFMCCSTFQQRDENQKCGSANTTLDNLSGAHIYSSVLFSGDTVLYITEL